MSGHSKWATIKHKKAALDATTQLWDGLREARFLSSQGLDLALAGSFGLATFPEDGNTVQAIMKSWHDNIDAAAVP